ncbi:MAG: hypothetical protein ACK47B_00620 [Armatimonadota bacterium]
MATSIETRERTGERPFEYLRATPEERARVLEALSPFDCEAWRREVTPSRPEELLELERFLEEREEDRQ